MVQIFTTLVFHAIPLLIIYLSNKSMGPELIDKFQSPYTYDVH